MCLLCSVGLCWPKRVGSRERAASHSRAMQRDTKNGEMNHGLEKSRNENSNDAFHESLNN